jgi:ubiquinone/menaquinone biosynthesis C-methylase UbiE
MSEMEFIPCNLCGADDYKVVYKASPGDPPSPQSQYCCTSPDLTFHDRIVRCQRCGLMYSNPRALAREVAKNYSQVEDKLYLEEKEGRVLTFNRSMAELEKVRKGGKLLDVGCYTGFFLEIARERGWEAEGVELSGWAAHHAREVLKLKVFHGTLQEAKFPDEHFDVVALWDVIEHMTDPLGELKEISRVLKKDGVVVLTTMFMDTVPALLVGEKYPFLMKMHLYYFTRKTLRKMMEKAGLQVFKTSKHVRVLRLLYFLRYIKLYSVLLYNLIYWIVKKLQWESRPVSISMSGLRAIYGKKTASLR